jgi:hypothetical protein
MRQIGALLLALAVATSLGALALDSPLPTATPAPAVDHTGHVHDATPVSNLVSYNKNTGKYHNSGCRYWGCKNCTTITREEAKRRGGVACKVCNG